MVFLAAVIRAVHLHGDLLRASTAVPGNDYRLGSHEAPPAVVSIYLGADLDEVCRYIMGHIPTLSRTEETLKFLGTHLPALRKDSADRNRTSPFAFTGNRFEYRAVGSSQSVAIPITVLNAIIADSLHFMADEIESQITVAGAANDPEARQVAIETVVRNTLNDNYSVVFNGDNYTEEYVAEAARRGLPHLRTAPEAIAAWDSPKNVELLDRVGVLTRREQEARSRIVRENFLGQLLTEAKAALFMARRHVLPAALTQQQQLATSLSAAKAVLSGNYEEQEVTLMRLRDHIRAIYRAIDSLEEILSEESHEDTDIRDKFAKFHPLLMKGMKELRVHCDALEEMVDASLWTLPSYNELLIH